MSLSRLQMRPGVPAVLAALVLAVLVGGAVHEASAQDSRETERRLQKVKRELRQAEAERKRTEGARGDVSRRLREAERRVAQSSRVLRETEARLARDREALAGLQQRRTAMEAGLQARRAELADLLRAAYRQDRATPLKALLARDEVAANARLLAYHGYVQRDRAARIAELQAGLRELETLEAELASRRASLDQLQRQQREQLAQLERDRGERARLLAQLDVRYQTQKQREQALGRDAQSLERLLKQLRADAAREARRRAAEAKAARAAAAKPGVAGTRAIPKKPVARGAAPQVGGTGWPLSGALLAGYGARMPDGRESHGLLIGATAGARVQAVADGEVVFAEWMTGYGLLTIVDHGNGYMSLYAHNDALLKPVGTRVRRGDPIATVGTSGGHGRPALYFELRREGQPVNPNAWLRR